MIRALRWIPALLQRYRSQARDVPNSANAYEIVDWLEELVSSADRQSPVVRQIAAFRRLGPADKERNLAGLYLSVEQYVTEVDRSNGYSSEQLRSWVRRDFDGLLRADRFKLIFVPDAVQKTLLAREYLLSVAGEIHHLLGNAHDGTLPTVCGWLQSIPNAPKTPPHLRLTDEEGESDDGDSFPFAAVAKDLYWIAKQTLGDAGTRRIFEGAYEDLASQYLTLDAFPSVVGILPEHLLDAEKIRLLSRSQVQLVLLDKIDRADQLNRQLAEQNASLEEARRNLKATHDQLEERVRERTEELTRVNKAKSEFLATISHELRTPMNGVLGMVGLLSRTELTSEQSHYAERIKQSGDALLGLLNNLLDIAKIEAGRGELEVVDFDLKRVVDGVTALMGSKAEGKGLSYDFEIDPETPAFLKGDFGRIQQILFNLIGNAIKFTESGGISIQASHIEQDDDMCLLRFDVVDTGIGIEAQKQYFLFDRFTQADASTTRVYGGTGLGLAICKELVELMDGEIGVESAPGRGSRFWFTVSCEKRPQDATAEPERQSPVGQPGDARLDRKLRFLVAEDNPVNQEIISMTLENDGHYVDVVGNGAEAVCAVQDAPYDVVLMDIHMPEMDGVTAAKKIRALAGDIASIPIIALTADAMVGDREKYIDSGMNDYASKPFELEDLYDAIRRHI